MTTYYQKNFTKPADLVAYLNATTSITGIDGIIPAWGKGVLVIYHITV